MQNLLYTQIDKKQTGGGSNTEEKTWQVYCFEKRNMRFDSQESREGFLSERKGKVITRREAEDGKSAGTNSVLSTETTLLTRELYAFLMFRRKSLDVALFPMLFLLSGVP